MENKSERYDRLDYSGPGVSKGLRFAAQMHMAFTNNSRIPRNILVLGAGAGYEIAFLKKCGYNVMGVDLSIPDIPIVKECSIKKDASKLPFKDKEFEWVFSFEMIEHIPYEKSLEVLRESQRVSENFFFSIADDDDPPFHTHINIHPGEFWIAKFKELGFRVTHAQIAPLLLTKIGDQIYITRFKNGMVIRGEC